jgi:hypothetical protein
VKTRAAIAVEQETQAKVALVRIGTRGRFELFSIEFNFATFCRLLMNNIA